MKISYSRLFAKLKENKMTQKDFKEKVGISSGTLANLVNNRNVTTETLCKICDYFYCMPEEIMEWIPEPNYPEDIKAKQNAKHAIEAQIAELQAKLKSF